MRTNIILLTLFILVAQNTIHLYGSQAGVIPTTDYLAENADIIVTGIVTDKTVGETSTEYSFKGYEVIKGSITKQFIITTNEGTRRVLSEPPARFEEGQEVLLFLTESNGRYSVFWESWGKYLLSAISEDNLNELRGEYRGSFKNTVNSLFLYGSIPVLILILYFIYHRVALPKTR